MEDGEPQRPQLLLQQRRLLMIRGRIERRGGEVVGGRSWWKGDAGGSSGTVWGWQGARLAVAGRGRSTGRLSGGEERRRSRLLQRAAVPPSILPTTS
jgi:hypothetical protein